MDYALYRVSFSDIAQRGLSSALVGTGVVGEAWLLSGRQARALRKTGVSCERLGDDEAREWQREQERRRTEMAELLWPIAERREVGR